MVAYFYMSKQTVPTLVLVKEVPFKVGEECDYWLKLGEYQQLLAIQDELLVDGKLTPAGLKAIDFDKELAKKRKELPGILEPRGQELKLKTRFSAQKQKVKSAFEAEVKALISKTGVVGFVHFTEKGDKSELKLKVPTDRGGTTTRPFKGSVSDIRRELNNFLDEIEVKSKRKHHR